MISGARLLAASLAALVGLGLTAPAHAAERPDRTAARKVPAAPGSLTGYAFDTCQAPPQAVMDAWWLASPYAGVGIYIGGGNRLCQEQPELSAGWVRTQQKRGWHLLPLYVGPQASCSGYAERMSSDRAVALQQGRAAAQEAVAIARALGIRTGATLYYDLEDYDIGPDDCRQAALSFLSGWTQQLHQAKYDSGVYSNVAAAVTSLDYAELADPAAYVEPDDIWFAWDNGQADTRSGSWVKTDTWDDHARIHQYALDVTEAYAGFALSVDKNWVDVGRGSVAPAQKPLCRGVDVDLRRYPNLRAGSRGTAVEAAECLLRRQGFTKAAPDGRYDKATAAAVRKAQRRLGLRESGKLTRPTWTALLARGSQPVLKVGSVGPHVSRLQRALTAAGRRTPITGLYDKRTAKAVARFQRKAGLPGTGVATPEVWDAFTGG